MLVMMVEMHLKVHFFSNEQENCNEQASAANIFSEAEIEGNKRILGFISS